MDLMLPKRMWEPRSKSLPDKNGFVTQWETPKWSSHDPTPLDLIWRKYMQRKYDILCRWKMGWRLRKKMRVLRETRK